MEIRYQRPVTYSIDLTDKCERDLAKHLGITRRKLNKLVDNAELLDEYYDEVTAWINDNEERAEFDATADIEDLEID